MADGYYLGLVNRVMTVDGTSDITLPIGAAVAGYPLVNLNDPDLALQARITPAAGAFRILIDLGAGPASDEADYMVNAFGLANHNLDGATIQVTSNTVGTWASSTTVWGPTTLSASSDNPNLFMPLQSGGNNTVVYKRFLWVDVTGAPSPTIIGNLFLGVGINIGYPMRPDNWSPSPVVERMVSAGGHIMPTIGPEPHDTWSLTFRNPIKLTKALVYDRTRHLAGSYHLYNTVFRHFRHVRQLDMGGNRYSGLSLAGGSIPTFWNEGDANGLSTAGRPARYGYWSLRNMGRNDSRDRSTLTFDITEATPKGVDTQPEY